MSRPSRARPAPRLALQLETVHLHGFSTAEQQLLLAALERELARLIAERGLPSTASLHLNRLRIDCAPVHTPGDAGRDAARLLYANLCLAGRPGSAP